MKPITTKDRYIADTPLHALLPVFYQPWWLDTVCSHWDVLLIYREQQVVLVWPYAVDRRWTLNLIRLPHLTPVLGPYLLTESHTEALLEEALSQLPTAAFHQFSTPYGQNDTTFWQQQKYQILKKTTYLIDLRPELPELLSGIEKKRQKLILKAEKELQVRETQLNVALFCDWLSQTFARKGERTHLSPAFIAAVDQAAREQKACVCLEVRDEQQQILSIQWLLYDHQSMYYMLSVTNPDVKHPSAAALLIWKGLCKAKELGLQYFDFEGSSIPGIAFFFKSFGGQKVNYPVYSRTNSVIWKWKQQLLG